jgi:hypothetical protein
MVTPRLLKTTMRIYKIGKSEAQWLLKAKVERPQLLSTGQVIAPNQSL